MEEGREEGMEEGRVEKSCEGMNLVDSSPGLGEEKVHIIWLVNICTGSHLGDSQIPSEELI